MPELHDSTYWIALAHLPNWTTEKINRLIVEILHNRKLPLPEFFDLDENIWKRDFGLKSEESNSLIKAKSELPNLSFLVEDLYAQGFEIIPLNSPEYPRILKDNLKIKYSPPILYVKGNRQLLNRPSIGVVGARNSSKVSLKFAEMMSQKCVENDRVVITGSARNVDKVVLDSTLKHKGFNIIVLPQGVMASSSEFEKYYSRIVAGDVVFVSMYFPKSGWSARQATDRNIIIYGISEGVCVIQTNPNGGTWSGAIQGIQWGRKVYIREASQNEKNANNMLLQMGAIPIDSEGNGFQVSGGAVPKDNGKIEPVRTQATEPASIVQKKQVKDIDRKVSEQKLKEIFGIDHFYDKQWDVIEKLLKGERILLIEKTGFGKSLCYEYPATQLPGITVIFSPLIALMRDQVSYLRSLGISSECINSEQTLDENRKILEEARHGKIKILYIAPERQENQEWMDAVRNLELSMVVVDEAHCISVWGHDFRPAFRRVINLVRLLPENFPVLATTATATQRVATDVSEQIGGNISIIRGDLLRENFNLRVVKTNDEDEKMAWLGEFLPGQEGTGLIYTGTRVDTEFYAAWLRHLGISATNYNAGFDAELRKEIEQGLMSNRWKCVVSTNALGMGIDKPDIRFIIHTQMPASPIHYYQEIGRAGRDGLSTEIALLYNPADRDLPEAFIQNARPTGESYGKAVEFLKQEPLRESDLARLTNLNRNLIRVMLADLVDQGIIRETMYGRTRKFEYQFDAKPLDTEPFEALRRFKFNELDRIIEYAESESCRMDYLCAYLGDPSVVKCEKCDNDLGQIHRSIVNRKWKAEIQNFRDNYFPEIKVALSRNNPANGVATSYYGKSNVGAIIHYCKYEDGGDFPDFLIQQTLKAYRAYFRNEKFDLMVYVPPTESGMLVENFAKKVGKQLNIPVSDGLRKKQETKPQKVFQNYTLKRNNVKDVFYYESISEIKGKSVLIIDDIFDSGATIREIGLMLIKSGAAKVAPLVIAKAVGGDLRND